MQLGKRILVIDDSRCMLAVLGQILRAHCSAILFASTYRDALKHLQQDPEIDAVICDVVLPDGNGFDLLAEIAGTREPLPKFLLITARWTEGDGQRARQLGAIGYLPKPVSLLDIRNALTVPVNPRARDARQPTFLKAWIVDPQRRERLLSFDIHNISTSGMLLDTKGPLPIGTELEFEIVYGDDELVRSRGAVVRVQESSWLDAGGSAIRFNWIESSERLAQLISRAAQPPRSA
jgi:CheY-like chemotaxis protein